jgi:hypothetical protein
MFNTASGDETSLCALHSQSRSALPGTTSSLLVGKTAPAVDGNDTSESVHDPLTAS